MLVISLKPREGVSIGENIRVYNNGVEAISIGIDAPREVPILRDNAKVKKAPD